MCGSEEKREKNAASLRRRPNERESKGEKKSESENENKRKPLFFALSFPFLLSPLPPLFRYKSQVLFLESVTYALC